MFSSSLFTLWKPSGGIVTPMRVWKLEANRYEDRLASRWGYALAATADEALEIARATSGLPLNWVHEKHPEMLWPGPPGARVDWDTR